jgi:DNA-directed RNA polymerase specialized sigma24 family protein
MSDNSTFDSIEKAVEQAQSGNQDALEHVLRTIKKQVYSFSVRMLWHPEDAKDAAQEILLRIVTHLSTFRGDSKFSTWVYRIACNHLLNFRKSRLETAEMTFESFGEDLAEGLSDQAKVHPDDLILLQEIRVGCTLGMLLCLDRAHRIAYIIGKFWSSIAVRPGPFSAFVLRPSVRDWSAPGRVLCASCRPSAA